MQIADLHKNLDKVEQLANASKLRRLMHTPYRYVQAILHRTLIYPKLAKGKRVAATTFFGEKMELLLPASTDIYLAGGKTHLSEIKLARFMLHYLQKGDQFVDVGAHYGYFSLLAATLAGQTGSVVSFEAAADTFAILDQNTRAKSNMLAINKAVSDSAKTLEFYQFPNLFSEYNSLDIEQYKEQAWFKEAEVVKQEIEAIPLSDYLLANDLHPKMIKIDVEGAEHQIIQGLATYLTSRTEQLFVAMEYLCAKRNNLAHKQATALMRKLGFQTYIISKQGELHSIEDIDQYLDDNALESDNVVFVNG